MSEGTMDKEQVWLAALAGLLHDIGKFAQRAGRPGDHAEVGAGWIECIRDLFPRDAWEDLVDAVAQHHSQSPHKRIAKVVRLADWLAAGERCKKIPRSEPASTPLAPILARVELTTARPEEKWGFSPSVLSLDNVFPQPGLGTVNAQDYATLWPQFEAEIGKLKIAGIIGDGRQFASLMHLLRKYLTFVPSAMPWEKGDADEERTLPDVSLYDHLKVTAAIAACLERGLSDDELDRLLRRDEAAWQQPVAVMVRGDLSGIQNFIYRITRPAGDATFRGVAKRLRGRSFYLALLGDVIGDWLIRRLKLTGANLLFCGGGRFDLLMPKDTHSRHELDRCLDALESWLLDTFYGELGVQFATQEIRPEDFGDMRRIYTELEHQLTNRKAQKWRRKTNGPHFFVLDKDEYHACSICHLVSMDEPRSCPMCDDHHRIGGKLPDTSWIAFVYDGIEASAGEVPVLFERFDTTVLLMNDDEAKAFLAGQRRKPVPALLYRLNNTDFVPDEPPSGLGLGFRFLANTAPTVQSDVLDFEEIADLSAGAKRLGVLKADVDHLGFIFSDGIEPSTISQQAALSHTVDLFFCGWLNRLCDKVCVSWKRGPGKDHPRRDEIGNLFYVLYSGGDDLFIVGPWDQVLELAQQLHEDFGTYACCNSNVTLSAGVVQVKPHYPVQRFAQLVTERLRAAKDAGRNRINVFNHSLIWHDDRPGVSYDWSLEFAEKLRQQIASKDMPRTLIHDIGRLYRRHHVEQDGHLKPMWTPELYYTLVRRLKKEVREEIQEDIVAAITERTVLVSVSYVSLITRKE